MTKPPSVPHGRQVSSRRVPRPYTPPRSRTGLAVLVLGLHVLGLGVALRLGAWQDRGPVLAAQKPLMLWLRNETPLRPAPAVLPKPPSALQRSTRPAPPAPAAAPQAITLPAEVPLPNTPTPAAAPAPGVDAPPATPAPAAPAAALNLALPRGASAPWRHRHPGLDDPRANTPRATVESRIAAALGGSDDIVEERLADGVMRFKRGNSCVLVHPNRAERIDPFNASVLPKMRGVEKC